MRQFAMLPLLLFLVACPSDATPDARSAPLQPAPAKYVFLFIGDGMGLAQVALAEGYRSSIQGDTLGFRPTSFSAFPTLGMATTQCATRRITESSAAATALATGSKANDGSLGLDPHDGTPLRTIAEEALQAGRSIGVVTTTAIDHATPAGFYAHVPNRNQSYDIGVALTRSGMNVFAGGPFLDPEGNGTGKPQESLWSLARKAGYEVIRGRQALQARQKDKVIAFPAPGIRDSSLPYRIDRRAGGDQPDLVDYVRESIRLLDNPKGFFLVAEGGKVDWACHRNDARTALEEVWGLDSAVRAALDFARLHPGEVLIVVTADHETGGLSLGNDRLGYQTNLGILRHQTLSGESLEDSLRAVLADKDSAHGWKTALSGLARWTGLGGQADLMLSAEETSRLREAFLATLDPTRKGPWGKYHPLAWTATRILSDKAGVGWTTPAHTAIPVPVYAWGAGAQAFGGRMDNTDIAHRLRRAMGLARP
jgi:alkaline phosphatase